VFGDNLERRGKKGQAVIRGLPNAVGVATKWRPSKDEDAYFYDSQYHDVIPRVERDLNVVERLLQNDRLVYLPIQMIGSGLAELPSRAPRIFSYVDSFLKRLYIEYKDEGLEAFLE
jgi:hypothetical protein